MSQQKSIDSQSLLNKLLLINTLEVIIIYAVYFSQKKSIKRCERSFLAALKIIIPICRNFFASASKLENWKRERRERGERERKTCKLTESFLLSERFCCLPQIISEFNYSQKISDET